MDESLVNEKINNMDTEENARMVENPRMHQTLSKNSRQSLEAIRRI